MNEQFEKIAKQAHVYADNLCVYEPENSGLFEQKFAELIVQECMKVAANQRNPANLNYNPSERFVEDLQQHFGVK